MNGPNKQVLVLEQPSVIYLCKDKPTLEESSNQVGSGLTLKHSTRLERLAKDKHSSLLRKSVNYGRKKFYSKGGF